MTALAEKVREEVLELPVKERAEIARVLIQSISPPVEPVSEEEFRVMLDRRVKDLEEGRVEPVPAEVVFERIRQKFL